MAAKLMHAVQYSGYGGGVAALKHVEVPVPDPKPDEVLLKVEAATLNPIDWKIQKGTLRPVFLPRKFPTIPGTDLAGEVVQIGSDVSKFKAGDKVVAMLSHAVQTCSAIFSIIKCLVLILLKSYPFDMIHVGVPFLQLLKNGGALAEYAAAKEKLVVSRPPEVSAAEAAGLLVAGLTALQALTQSANIRLDGTGELKNILITAASGGVGHYAVQLSKLGNTHVTATCGARNIDFVKSLGADEVLDYRTPDGAALKSPSGKKYDYVIHCTSDIPWSTFEPNLSETGKVIDLTPSPSALWTFAMKKLTFSKKQLVPLLLIPKAENLEHVVNLVKEGKLKTVINSKHPLSKAEDAWAKMMESHATGKVIIEP